MVCQLIQREAWTTNGVIKRERYMSLRALGMKQISVNDSAKNSSFECFLWQQDTYCQHWLFSPSSGANVSHKDIWGSKISCWNYVAQNGPYIHCFTWSHLHWRTEWLLTYEKNSFGTLFGKHIVKLHFSVVSNQYKNPNKKNKDPLANVWRLSLATSWW